MSTTSFASGAQTIPGGLYIPYSGSAWPVVVLVHGTEGMTLPFAQIIQDLGTELAKKGMLTFIPEYFNSTNTLPGYETVLAPVGAKARFGRWVSVLQEAVNHLAGLPGARGERAALVGFSLGGHLALRTAAKMPVKAVVDFFGPVTSLSLLGSCLTSTLVRSLPPTQIHHGDRDSVVNIAESRELDQLLAQHSIAHELYVYRDNGHPGQQSVGWDAQAQKDSTARTIDFLLRAFSG